MPVKAPFYSTTFSFLDQFYSFELFYINKTKNNEKSNFSALFKHNFWDAAGM